LLKPCSGTVISLSLHLWQNGLTQQGAYAGEVSGTHNSLAFESESCRTFLSLLKLEGVATEKRESRTITC